MRLRERDGSDVSSDGMVAAASGLRAGLQRLDDAARNIQNISREGARRVRTEQVETPSGGTRAISVQTEERIDLVGEMIEQIRAREEIGMSASYLRIHADLDRNVLDILT